MNFLPGPLKALAERFDQSPIDTVEKLTHFLHTRSAYVAQTSLYGYLKTRMGTRYRDLFQDEVFSVAIRQAAMKVFVSALADLTIFSVAVTQTRTDLDSDEAKELARHCFVDAMNRVLAAEKPEDIPQDASAAFQQRLPGVVWSHAAEGENAFHGSASDLIRFAPVVDEFKEQDSEIVANSIRFRWRDVRTQLRKRANGPAIADSWHQLGRRLE